jgi:opacity protein-like surface antigen
MKKLFGLLILIPIANVVQAQDSRISIGIEMNPIMSTLRGKSTIGSYDSRFEISPAISLNYCMTSQFLLETGFAFARKGAKTELIFTDFTGTPIGNVKVKMNFDYLCLPLLVSFSTNGRMKFYASGGGYFGYLISQKNKYELPQDLSEPTDDTAESIKKIDIGLSLGVGLNYPIGDRIALRLGLNDNLGLLNISKLILYDNDPIRTNSFGLAIGLKYRI